MFLAELVLLVWLLQLTALAAFKHPVAVLGSNHFVK